MVPVIAFADQASRFLEGEQQYQSMPEQIVVKNSSPRLKIALLSVAASLGLILAICGASFQGDTISYLDMGDYFFAGDWRAILNGLWSPLFPFIHGLTRWFFKPAMHWEPTLFQLTNFILYTFTVLAFQFFWSQLFHLYKVLSQRKPQSPQSIFSENEFWILGYAIFLFMHLDLMAFMSPDMLLSAIVYLVVGLILNIKLRGPTLLRFSFLGLLLGVGFLAKAVMLPLAGVFLAAAVLPNLRQRFLLFYTLAASVAFAGVVSPYLYELSREKGHFTTGEAARLNYAWHVHDVPFVHWQGEMTQLGKPEHPPRQIFSSPLIYEFGTPVRGTYPPWYDPSYWEEGLQARFDVTDQLRALSRNLNQYLRALWAQNALIACVLVLLALRRDVRSTLHDFLNIWFLWLPPAIAFGLYGLIWVEHRYVSQFFVLFWAAALILVRLPGLNESRRVIRVVTTVAVLLLTLRIGINLAEECMAGHQGAVLQMNIAEGLSVQGVNPGEKVALIDAGLGKGWQKLAHLVVVAEIPSEERDTFWAADTERRKQIYHVLAESAAKVLIAPETPNWAQVVGWEKVGATPVYIYRLTP
jgi:hypothetical protein